MNRHDPTSGSRRGVLLLLVLSALTMFMMLGALMLVLATRTRTAARAFSTASTAVSRDDGRGRAALDEALMRLLRGPLTTTSGTQESILADQYGSGSTGSLTGLTRVNAGTLSGTLAGFATGTSPLALNGRVLTIRPPVGDPAPIASYRIVAYTGSTSTVTLANLRSVMPFRQLASTTSACTAIINGRDFGNEPWDKPGAENPFLTAAALQSGTVTKPAFGVEGQSCEVDNDGDGVADGIWLTGSAGFLPPQPYESGTVSFRVSYAVFDLDGRVNVNAHGLPPSPPDDRLGPASVDVADVMGNHVWVRLLNGGTLAAASPASGQQRRLAPALGGNYTVDGRTGRLGNAPSPYDVRLDFDGPRPGTTLLAGERVVSGTIGSLFTPGELERVLRPFDADAAALAPRLAGILGDDGERARALLTTDSWDTTALTGSASVITSSTATTGLPQQVIAGRRFNINSGSVGTPADKQVLFDQLLAVVLAAGVPSGTTTAQWVANVVDFRDEDSVGTQFNVGTNYAGMPGTVTGFDPVEYMVIGGHEDCDEFVSIGQLLCVPQGSAQQLSDPNLSDADKKLLRKSLAVDHPVILDAVTVESLFTATVAANPWREPGRVNVNTCEEDVWKAVLGGGAPTNPFSPARSSGGMLNHDICFNANTDPSRMDNRDYSLANVARANRLANIATTRSNVFAVWITVELTDSAVPDQKTFRRLFAIVDRSIPVGFSPGLNLNVRDTLRLVRYLE